MCKKLAAQSRYSVNPGFVLLVSPRGAFQGCQTSKACPCAPVPGGYPAWGVKQECPVLSEVYVTSCSPQTVCLVISEGDMENSAPDWAQTDESNRSISSPFTTAVPPGIFQIRSDCCYVAKQTTQMDGERSDRYSRGGHQLSRRAKKYNYKAYLIWLIHIKLVLCLYRTISGQ